MQNFAASGSSVPQCEQRRGNGAPHSMQNLARAVFSVPQPAHRIAARPCRQAEARLDEPSIGPRIGDNRRGRSIWSMERIDGPTRTAWCHVILAIGLTIFGVGCAPGERATSTSGAIATASPASPVAAPSVSPATQPGTAGADDLLAIESNTQAHVGQLAIGAGNFWEDEYTPPGEAARRGLTAGLWLTYRDDPAQNRQLRVYPGQEIVVPGYRLRVISVEPRVVRLAIRREP